MPDIELYMLQRKREKENQSRANRKQEFLGVRREERQRVLDELLKQLEDYSETISIDTLKNIIQSLLEKDYEKPRRFC